MAAKKIYDATATVGSYVDREGQEKKRYVTVGAVMQSDDGRLALKLNAIPVGPDFNGWINFYEPRQQQAPQQQSAPAPKPSIDDEDIPF